MKSKIIDELVTEIGYVRLFFVQYGTQKGYEVEIKVPGSGIFSGSPFYPYTPAGLKSAKARFKREYLKEFKSSSYDPKKFWANRPRFEKKK
jgi:hypothetical protein